MDSAVVTSTLPGGSKVTWLIAVEEAPQVKSKELFGSGSRHEYAARNWARQDTLLRIPDIKEVR